MLQFSYRICSRVVPLLSLLVRAYFKRCAKAETNVGAKPDIFYEATHEWPDDVSDAGHISTGSGALWRTHAEEVVQWRARSTSSSCSLAQSGNCAAQCAKFKLPTAQLAAKCPEN